MSRMPGRPEAGSLPPGAPVRSANAAPVNEPVYTTLELIGSSDKGFQEAIQRAIAKAHETIRNIRWFEVRDTRGQAGDGQLAHWQVTLRIGFRLEGKP